jgi:tetratricopeptide (TPR) repeat protein
MTAQACWLLGAIVAAGVLAAYYPALANGYVWDDHIYFSAYPADVYFASWWSSGREPFAISANYFRPLAMLTFLADFAAGPTPIASHLINLSIHALNAALVGLLAARLLSLRSNGFPFWIPAVAGLWYGLHPALIEAAAMVMCRFDLVATACSLLLLHVSLSAARWALPALSLLYLAALFSKESAAGLLAAWPFWVVAVAWLRGKVIDRALAAQLLQGWAALGVGLALCVLIRFWARGYVWAFGDAELVQGSYLGRIAMSMAQQIRLMVMPFGGVDPFHTAASFGADSYAVAALALGVAGFALSRAGSRAWAALFLGAIAMLAPSSNVMPISFAGGVYTADRYLTLPLVLAAPAVAAALCWAWRGARAARVIAAAVLAVWLVGSVALVRTTLPLMRDDASFWGWVVQLHPDEVVAQNNLADALIERGRAPAAIQVLAGTLATNAGDAALWHNLARAHDALGELPQAMDAIDRAIALDPTHHFWHTKAALVAKAGDLPAAERIIRDRVLATDPALVAAHLNLIRLLIATGRSAEAEAHIGAHGDVFVGHWREQARALLASGGT